TDCLGFSAPIQRWQVRKPGTRCRSGMCSVSYQSLNSSSATFEKSIAAIKTPFAMAVPSDFRKREMLRRESRTVQPSGRRAGDRRGNQLGGLLGIHPAHELNPLAPLQILVVAEEMGDLVTQDRRQVPIRADGAVERVQRVDRDSEDLLVRALLILHEQGADRPAAHYRPRHDRCRSDDQ